MNQFSLDALAQQLIAIPRCDRWQAYQRLQELDIACQCAEDGSLWVEIQGPLTILQLRSVVQHLTCSRQELIGWLNQCWQANP